jgi:hypothetical protein
MPATAGERGLAEDHPRSRPPRLAVDRAGQPIQKP